MLFAFAKFDGPADAIGTLLAVVLFWGAALCGVWWLIKQAANTAIDTTVDAVKTAQINSCKAKGMTDVEAEAARQERMRKVGDAAANCALPVSFGIMVILTIGMFIPISWPLLAFYWYRYFRQVQLYKQKEVNAGSQIVAR